MRSPRKGTVQVSIGKSCPGLCKPLWGAVLARGEEGAVGLMGNTSSEPCTGKNKVEWGLNELFA